MNIIYYKICIISVILLLEQHPSTFIACPRFDKHKKSLLIKSLVRLKSTNVHKDLRQFASKKKSTTTVPQAAGELTN